VARTSLSRFFKSITVEAEGNTGESDPVFVVVVDIVVVVVEGDTIGDFTAVALDSVVGALTVEECNAALFCVCGTETSAGVGEGVGEGAGEGGAKVEEAAVLLLLLLLLSWPPLTVSGLPVSSEFFFCESRSFLRCVTNHESILCVSTPKSE
jgi:hypothetical protein